MKIVWAVIALFAVRFIFWAWSYPLQDADLAWQAVLGLNVLTHHAIPQQLGAETFTAPRAPWVPQEWLFSTAVAAAFADGTFWMLAVITTLAAVAALVIVAYHSRYRGASDFAIACVTLCTGVAMMQSFGVRAQVFGWPLLAAMLVCFESEGALQFFAIPLVAVWANLHAGVMLAPALAIARAAGITIEEPMLNARVRRAALLAGGVSVAVLCTPFGWKLPMYAVSLFNSPFKSTISEWQPADLTYYSFCLGVLPLVAAAIWLGVVYPGRRWHDGILFAVMLGMAFFAVRSLSLCAITIAPMVAVALTRIIPQKHRLNTLFQERMPRAVLAVATLGCGIALGATMLRTRDTTVLPQRAVATLAGMPGIHRVYCEDFAWCSLALRHANLQTFIDGRCDPFPIAVWNAYVRIEKLTPQWDSTLGDYGVDAVIAGAANPIAQALSVRGDWRVAYRDGRFALFVRRSQHTARR
ncbi:MAG: hypothetical protein JO165_13240 [Candidatus Eremiobacteraeota bacterium]|nr:hypothetical protein [Candidatus Eremiobacteraeota bacterium]